MPKDKSSGITQSINSRGFLVGKVASICRANFARWRVRIPKTGWHLLAHLDFDILRCHRVSKIFELYSMFSTTVHHNKGGHTPDVFISENFTKGRKMQGPNTGIWHVTTVLLGLWQLSIGRWDVCNTFQNQGIAKMFLQMSGRKQGNSSCRKGDWGDN